MSSARTFVSGYLLQCDDKQVGFTTKSFVDKEERSGRLIGYDLKPDINKYNKIIQVVGDERLDGIILPDAKLLVRISDFMSGNFVGIEVRRDVVLRKKFVLMRDGRETIAFSLGRVAYTRPEDESAFDVSKLKGLIGGEGWQPVARKQYINQNAGAVPKVSVPLNRKEKKSSSTDTNKEEENRREKREVRVKNLENKDPINMNIKASGEVSYVEYEGDIFEVSSGLIINAISADIHMGAGIAVDFAKLYPQDKEVMLKEKMRVGRVYISNDQNSIQRGYLITKNVYNAKPNENTMRLALNSLVRECESRKIKEINTPLIGCGLDGMDWNVVRKLIESIVISKGISVKVWVLPKKYNKISEEMKKKDIKKGGLDEQIREQVADVQSQIEKMSENIENLKWFEYDDIEEADVYDYDLANSVINLYVENDKLDAIGFRGIKSIGGVLSYKKEVEFEIIFIYNVMSAKACLCRLRGSILCTHSIEVVDSDGNKIRVGVVYSE